MIVSSREIVVNAGAIIDVDIGDTNANAAAIAVTRHRKANGQFFGSSGSSVPSQVTYEPVRESRGSSLYLIEYQIRVDFWLF
jgi:hypothetical protein